MSVSLLKFREVYMQFGETMYSGIGTPICKISVQMHINNYRNFCEEFLPADRIGKHREPVLWSWPAEELDVDVCKFSCCEFIEDDHFPMHNVQL
jgi:hypothetical protein